MSDEPETPAPRDPWAPPADVAPSAPDKAGTPIAASGSAAPASAASGPGPYPGAGTVPSMAPGAGTAAPGPYDPNEQPYEQPYEPYSGRPGYPAYPMAPYDAIGWTQPPRNGFGVAALVLGIVGLILAVLCFGAILGAPVGIAAIVFGVMGRRLAKRGEATNGGQALAGLILGIGATVLSAAMITVLGLSIKNGWFASDDPLRQPDQGTYGSPLSEGGTASYDDGVEVMVSGAQEYSAPQYTTDGGSAMQFTVTVKNTGSRAVDLSGNDVTAHVDGDDENALKDISKGDGLRGKLAPGATKAAAYIVVVPGSEYDSVELDVAPGSDYDYSYWDVDVPAADSKSST